MKIAVVSDDHQTVSAHFGRAIFYEVFMIVDGKVNGHLTLNKPAHGHSMPEMHHEHGQPHGTGPEAEHHHGQMLEPIRDCQVLVARGMGQGAYDSLLRAGIQPVLTDILEVEKAVQAYLDGVLTDHSERLH